MTRIVLAALALACAAFLILVPLAAIAQEVAATTGGVPIPWGDWLAIVFKTFAEAAIPLAASAIGFAALRLPWWVKMWLTTARIDRMVRLGADYAINAVEGAAVGKVHSIAVSPGLMCVGLERILGSTDAWIKDEAGGPKGIAERLFREFKFNETVSDRNTLTPLIEALPNLPFVDPLQVPPAPMTDR